MNLSLNLNLKGESDTQATQALFSCRMQSTLSTIETEHTMLIEPRPESVKSFDSHAEPHFGNAEVVRDVIIGLSDGLTVPFALSAGLASLSNSRLVLVAGIAEIVAGSISMGLGGYLAGLSELEHYDSERGREEYEVVNMPEREEEEIYEIFQEYGVERSELAPLVGRLKRNPTVWVDFMMKFELGLERPNANRTWISALTIGSSYLVGGVIPLLPYMFIADAHDALYVSAATTITALFIFGYFKAFAMGTPKRLQSALQMTFIGAVAAACAYGIARLLPIQ